MFGCQCGTGLYKEIDGDSETCQTFPNAILRPIIRVEEMEADRQRNKVDLTNLTISDLGIYASPNAAVKLSTRHNAEGRARTIGDRPR